MKAGGSMARHQAWADILINKDNITKVNGKTTKNMALEYSNGLMAVYTMAILKKICLMDMES